MCCPTSKNSKSLAVKPSALLNPAGLASMVFLLCFASDRQNSISSYNTVPVDPTHEEYCGLPLSIRDKSQACNMRFCASGARHSSIGQLQICTSVSVDGETPGNYLNNVLLTINVISVFSRRISNIPPAQSRFRCASPFTTIFLNRWIK